MNKKISFYPGPSRIEDKVPKYISEASESGILSMNHRSESFMNLLYQNDKILKKKLEIPEDYRIYYTSSATECWEIISQSLGNKLGSHHLIGGAFAEKWSHYSSKINKNHSFLEFNPQAPLRIEDIKPPEESVICLTQNETSNGSCINMSVIADVRKKYGGQLVAIDATSSMAGIYLDFSKADIWFASVQKCFGIPSGLGVLICSPMAVQKSQEINETDHYNSLLLLEKNMKNWQTTHTPNILGIYLIHRVMQERKKIRKVDRKIRKRAKEWFSLMDEATILDPHIKDVELRSNTVMAFEGKSDLIGMIKKRAYEEGFILGNGYGDLMENTFRVANFPAIKKSEIKSLKEILASLI